MLDLTGTVSVFSQLKLEFSGFCSHSCDNHPKVTAPPAMQLFQGSNGRDWFWMPRLVAHGCEYSTGSESLFEGGAEVADHAELGEDDRAFRIAVETLDLAVG
jgi:hypothetical protein